MNQLAPIAATHTPALIAAAGPEGHTRFLEFFAANIRNKDTRRAYAIAAQEFLAWCESAGVASIADIATKICNHTFRATGITAYLKNGGTLERAAIMANHASTRTTQLYDRRRDDVSLDEMERILV